MRASLTAAAWVVANALPLVPIRITWANRLLGGRCRGSGIEIASHRRQFTRGNGVDGGLVEFEKLA